MPGRQLDDNAESFMDYDLIIPSPTFVGPRARRRWDHVSLIVEKAAVEAAGRRPFHLGALPVVRKTSDTPSMTGLPMHERRERAETDLRQALEGPDPSVVDGRLVLVIDDVFTEGSTLREIARALRQAGAVAVGEVVLARQPWNP